MTFTPEFYKEFYDQVMKEGKNIDFGRADERDYIPIDFYIGDMYVTLEAHYVVSVDDRSFDHAFGTWHDPCPSLEVEGCDDVYDVKVYESDDRDAPEAGEFDYDAFWSQFEQDTCGYLKKGARVCVWGREGVFLAYNYERGEHKILFDDGEVHYVTTTFVKRIKTA